MTECILSKNILFHFNTPDVFGLFMPQSLMILLLPVLLGYDTATGCLIGVRGVFRGVIRCAVWLHACDYQ